MALARKAATIIEIHGPVKADDSDLDGTTDIWMATYKFDVTGMGPLQNKTEKDGTAFFTVAAGDTSSVIAASAKAAVDAAIAAG